MQATHYLQKMIVRKVLNDDEYLGADAEISPGIIDLISLKSEIVASQNACYFGRIGIKLDEYELAMAS